MAALVLVLFHACTAALSVESQQTLADALARPLVDPGSVQEEVGAYVRSHVPALVPPESREVWESERDRLREAFLEQVVFRGVPPEWRRPETPVQWRDTLDPGRGYTIKKLLYEALPGLSIPAVLYLPDGLTERAPAVLNVNGHVGAPGKAHEEEQIRCINLAKRGIIALHPEWFSFGELKGDGYNHNRLAYLDLVGASGLSVFYLALTRAIDVLESHGQVDPNRIMVTGLSGGGWQTILLSALDPRVAGCVPNAGYIGIDVRTHYPGDIGDLEQIPTDFLTVGDYTHLTALLAPRPTLLIYNAKDECCFEASHSVPAIHGPILPWYALYGAESRYNYHINYDPGTHDYGPDNRRAFYSYLRREFIPEAAWEVEDLPWDGEIFTPEDLYAGLREGNQDFITLARTLYEKAGAAGGPSVPPQGDPTRESWRKQQQDALRKTLAMEDFAASEGEYSEATIDGLAVTTGTLKMGTSWTVPAALLHPEDATGDALTIIIADDGMASSLDLALHEIDEGRQVLLLDILFLGQNKPGGHVYQYPMLINATGRRALGVQAGQVAAAVDYARNHLEVSSCRMIGKGWNAATAALIAAALSRGTPPETRLLDAPESLFALVEQQVSYNDMAPLFAFGMLPNFDLPILKALASAP
jgi:dienelactone hydrolase